MKTKLIFTLILTIFSGAAFADADATPSAQIALKQAQDFAFNKAFSNILDESSSVSIVPNGENASQYLFSATAKNPGLDDCNIEIKVSKETGMAFQDEIQACQNL